MIPSFGPSANPATSLPSISSSATSGDTGDVSTDFTSGDFIFGGSTKKTTSSVLSYALAAAAGVVLARVIWK